MSSHRGKTLGTARLAGDEWKISAEPHILLRLKRIFERVAKGEHGTVTLADTLENCRDLHWFMERYPLSVCPTDRARMLERSIGHREHVLTMERITGARHKPRAFELAVPPRPYQAIGAEIHLRQGFLLNCDDLGLGKSCTAICSLTDRRALPAVVVAYPHLQRQWEAEIAKFAPALRTHRIRSSSPYPLAGRGRRSLKSPDVLIITYSKLSGWAEVLAAFAKSVIYDECQELRRAESAKYSAARHVSEACRFRLGLTATPIYNYGGEVFNILDALSPGCLGTRDEFYREWCEAKRHNKEPAIKDPKAFGTYLRHSFLMIRRTRLDVARELPPVIKIPHRIDCDLKALNAIADPAAELARLILEEGARAQGERMMAAEQLSNLVRQATGISKAPYVAEFVRMLVANGERVILCGWHRAVYDVWAASLKEVRVGWYTGTESPAAKEETKRKFIAGELDVVLLSLRSGAGLDGLQGICRTIVFGELDWAPAVHEQAIGRLHRDGQANAVTAYFLMIDGGSDPIMAEVLGLKREQLEGVRNPTQDPLERFDSTGGHVRRLAEQYLKKTRSWELAEAS